MGAKTLLTVEHLHRLPETCDVSYEPDQRELVQATATRQIHVHSAIAHPAILTPEDLLDDAALVPGFSARGEELFAV